MCERFGGANRCLQPVDDPRAAFCERRLRLGLGARIGRCGGVISSEKVAVVAVGARTEQETSRGIVGRADRTIRADMAGQLAQCAPAKIRQRRAGDTLVLGVLAENVQGPKGERGGRRRQNEHPG